MPSRLRALSFAAAMALGRAKRSPTTKVAEPAKKKCKKTKTGAPASTLAQEKCKTIAVALNEKATEFPEEVRKMLSAGLRWFVAKPISGADRHAWQKKFSEYVRLSLAETEKRLLREADEAAAMATGAEAEIRRLEEARVSAEAVHAESVKAAATAEAKLAVSEKKVKAAEEALQVKERGVSDLDTVIGGLAMEREQLELARKARADAESGAESEAVASLVACLPAEWCNALLGSQSSTNDARKQLVEKFFSDPEDVSAIGSQLANRCGDASEKISVKARERMKLSEDLASARAVAATAEAVRQDGSETLRVTRATRQERRLELKAAESALVKAKARKLHVVQEREKAVRQAAEFRAGPIGSFAELNGCSSDQASEVAGGGDVRRKRMSFLPRKSVIMRHFGKVSSAGHTEAKRADEGKRESSAAKEDMSEEVVEDEKIEAKSAADMELEPASTEEDGQDAEGMEEEEDRDEEQLPQTVNRDVAVEPITKESTLGTGLEEPVSAEECSDIGADDVDPVETERAVGHPVLDGSQPEAVRQRRVSYVPPEFYTDAGQKVAEEGGAVDDGGRRDSAASEKVREVSDSSADLLMRLPTPGRTGVASCSINNGEDAD